MTKTEVEVITSAEPRRRWSAEEKRRIVAAAIEPGAVVSEVARAAGIPVSQLFHWRKQLCGPAREKPGFAAVTVSPSAGSSNMIERGAAADHGRDRRGDRVGDDQGAGQGHRASMIPIPTGVRVWLATGHTDMRKGFASLSLQVQEVLRRDPLNGHLFCFRGRRGNLLKVIWHDGQGACLFTKRLERGRFLWPSQADGVVTISPAQLGYLLSGIDWRHPQETWRPTSVG
jgi:transposase